MILCSLIKRDEASYFVVSEDSGGDAADVGPSGVWTSKGSPLASSSIGWTTEASASEGEPCVPPYLPKSFLWSLVKLALSSRKSATRDDGRNGGKQQQQQN